MHVLMFKKMHTYKLIPVTRRQSSGKTETLARPGKMEVLEHAPQLPVS